MADDIDTRLLELSEELLENAKQLEESNRNSREQCAANDEADKQILEKEINQ